MQLIGHAAPQDDVKVDRSKVQNIEPGNISREGAEMRADIGKERAPTFTEAQAFDGPAPETINVSPVSSCSVASIWALLVDCHCPYVGGAR